MSPLTKKLSTQQSPIRKSSTQPGNNNNNNNNDMSSSGATTTGRSHQQSRVALLQRAIISHSRHLSTAVDSGGKLVAFINLGLCLQWLGDITQAAKHFQDALRAAIKMQTLYGQSIAVGNLGLLALRKNDFHTARTCFDQHLQLIQALLDPEAEIAAWKLVSLFCLLLISC